MPYDVSKIKGKRMTKFKMLTNAKSVIDMRKAIETNAQHKGRDFQVAYQGYVELHQHQNLRVPKYKSGCSGCIHAINRLLKNWLKAYDSSGVKLGKPNAPSMSQAIKPKGNTLVPLAARRKTLEESSYNDLKQAAVESGVYDKAKEMNNGKMPKKATLIDLILNV